MSIIIRRMNKKAVSPAIYIVTISSLLLSIGTLGYFLIEQGNMGNVIKISNEIDKVYLNELLLNFYLENIFDNSVSDFNVVQGKQVFIDNFLKELRGYKDKKGEYPTRELAIAELEFLNGNVIDNVEIIGDRLFFRLELKLKNYHTSKDNDLLLDYNYVKEFEKVFK